MRAKSIPWSDDEIKQLREQYGKVRCEDININGRPADSLRWKARKLGMWSKNRGKLMAKAWTELQDRFMRENYGKISAAEIGKAIGRNQASVFVRAYNLHITLPVKGRIIKPLTISKDVVDRYEAGETLTSVASSLGVCEETLKKEMRRVGVAVRTAAERALLIGSRRQGLTLKEWKGYKGKQHLLRQCGKEWAIWRRKVFSRDIFSCVMCGDCQRRGHRVTLDPHHIRPKAQHPELIYDVDNGVTLCRRCHRSIARKEHEYAKNFEDYVKSACSIKRESPPSRQLKLELQVKEITT